MVCITRLIPIRCITLKQNGMCWTILELVLVSNTVDILKPSTPSSKKAVLSVPGLQTKWGHQVLNNLWVHAAGDSAQRFMNGNTVTELPGTRAEVNAIEALLKPKLDVTKYIASDASEEKWNPWSPRLLHIATHGFFSMTFRWWWQSAGYDRCGKFHVCRKSRLLRSGLLFAGAGRTISEGRQGDQTEDGVLTAFEAMNLNLNQTDMVVNLSMWNRAGAGANRWRRSWIVARVRAAGAQSALMSLWKVDDQATQKLMTGFYSEWLSKGKNKPLFVRLK